MKKKNVVFAATKGFNEVLNWAGNPVGEFLFYGDAYHQAGKDLIKAGLKNRSNNSIKFAPAIFVYRQALELTLKSIIIHGSALLEFDGESSAADERIFSTHSLTQLMQAVETIYNHMGWTEGFEKGWIKGFADCKTVINDFNAIDAQSYAFRYPIDTKGKGSLDHHFTFDMQVFVARLDPMIELMSSMAYALEQEYDLRCDARGEAQQAAMEYEYENADHGDPGDYDTE